MVRFVIPLGIFPVVWNVYYQWGFLNRYQMRCAWNPLCVSSPLSPPPSPLPPPSLPPPPAIPLPPPPNFTSLLPGAGVSSSLNKVSLVKLYRSPACSSSWSCRFFSPSDVISPFICSQVNLSHCWISCLVRTRYTGGTGGGREGGKKGKEGRRKEGRSWID